MIKRLLPAIALLTLCLFAAPRPVMAFSFFQGVDCSKFSGNDKPTACQSQPPRDAHGNPVDPLTGPDGILSHITDIVAYIAGAAAIIMIIISAFKFITSGSNVSTGSRTDTDVEDARRGLANAVIGLVVIVLARTLIIYVVDRL
jgi:Na+-driven multidrug efflux pump